MHTRLIQTYKGIIRKSIIFILITSLVFIQFFTFLGNENKVKAATDGLYEWGLSLGGTNADSIKDIATDSSNNIYIVGKFKGTNIDLDATSGVALFTSSSSTLGDIFVSKYSSQGAYQWTIQITGTTINDAAAEGIVVDGSGNVYITAYVYGSGIDFDPGAGNTNYNTQNHDIFIAKYDTLGNYLWSVHAGYGCNAFAHGIDVDPNGYVYITGTADVNTTCDFDGTAGTDNHATDNGVFISKYDSSGNYGWTRTFANNVSDGSLWNRGRGIVASSTDVYIAGYYAGTNVDFDASASTSYYTSNSDNTSSAPKDDYFVTKYNSNGDYQWTRTPSTVGLTDYAYGIALDSSENVYVTGDVRAYNNDFDPTAGTDTKSTSGASHYGGVDDIFISKYDSAGNYVFTQLIGGTHTEASYDIDVTSNSIFVTGSFEGFDIDFDPGVGTALHSVHGLTYYTDDAFVAKYNLSDGSYEWSKTFGGEEYESGNAITVDSSGYVLSIGLFQGVQVDMDGTSGSDLHSSLGSSDGYITKYQDADKVGITNLDSAFDVEDVSTGYDAEVESVYLYGSARSIMLKKAADSRPIGIIQTNLTTSRNWGTTTITGDVDLVSGKSFVHNLQQAEGTDTTFSLMVPKLAGQSAVHICPDAQSLAAVTTECASGYTLTLADDNVSITSEEGQEYWLVSGLNGTGGLGISGNTPTMRVELADDSTSATDDVEVWFDTPTNITPDSLIYIIYETVFTGGSSIGTSDVSVYCDEDGLSGGTSTGMTSVTVASALNGYLELDVNSDTCSNWIQVDIHGGGGNHLTNPGDPGNYSFGVLTDVGGDGSDDDSGATLAYVGDDNDVNITAIIPPTVDLELYQQGSDLELTDANACTLGVLSINQVNTCVYDLGTGTNNQSGLSVYMTSDGSLDDGNGNNIGSPSGAVTAGEAEYGFYLSDLGGGEYTAAGSYNTQHQAVPTSETLIASTSDTGSGTTVGSTAQHLEVTHAASMSTSTVVGSYNQVITYTAYTN